jgi:hypothetical protein
VLTLTHLREPAAQALSAWHYWPRQWAREGVRSLDGWLARQLPDRIYDEFALGRAATPSVVRAGGPSSAAGSCARWRSEVEARWLSAVDVVGTDRNWERTWLRLAHALRLPRLVPRAHRGLVTCERAQRLRVRSGPLSERCRAVEICRASRANASHVRALRARHACSLELYAAWAARSEAALEVFEAGLAQRAARDRDGESPGRERASASGTAAFSGSARALFRERTCQLRAGYFCNLQLSEPQRAQLGTAEAARLALRARKAAARASLAPARPNSD